MARIRHIAIGTRDPEATARFYMEGLGLKQVGKVNTPTSEGYYLSDGHVNLAILAQIEKAGAVHRPYPGTDEMAKRGNVEVKFTVPDGVTVDLSEHGWLGTK